MSARRITTLLAGVVGVVLLFAATAAAKPVGTYTPAGSFTGSDAVGGPAFGGSSLEKIAVDDATGDFYVAGETGVYKFGPNGASAPFSALTPNTVITTGIGSGPLGGLAVDNSGGTTQGRIYAFGRNEAMNAYEADGSPAGGAFPIAPEAESCAVAVAANGDIWRKGYEGKFREYTPSGTPTGEEVAFPKPHTPAASIWIRRGTSTRLRSPIKAR